MHSFIRSCIHSLVCSLTCSLARSLFTDSLAPSPTHPSIHPSIHPTSVFPLRSGTYCPEWLPARYAVLAISTPVTVHAGSTQLWSLQAFDYETGRPKRYVEMLSWPRAHRLHRALPTVLAGVFWESFVPTKAAATMRMVLNRYSRPQDNNSLQGMQDGPVAKLCVILLG